MNVRELIALLQRIEALEAVVCVKHGDKTQPLEIVGVNWRGDGQDYTVVIY